MNAIEVVNISKAYKRYPNRWSRLVEWISPKGKKYHSLKWVMSDVSFNVKQGEAVGIIGINGAGKSTLLKIITGTTKPTRGRVEIKGRVAALLELGIGFHPDFTGRQNVYMAGQLLGYTVEEISKLIPDIEKFSEIGDYIDQPVRVYSSGMQMRLAFSLATASRPDILIVDEALSVGDAYFQHKSFDRIREYKKLGTTLLIVSHDKGAIQSICDRAILINGGELEMEGVPEVVMDYYNALLSDNQEKNIQQVEKNGRIQTVSGTGEATVTNISLINNENKKIEVADVGQLVKIHVEIEVKSDIDRLVFGYCIKDRLGQFVYGTNTHYTKQPLFNVKAGDRYTYFIEFLTNVGEGNYSIQTALVSDDTHLKNNYEWRDLALVFSVVNFSRIHFVGGSWIEPKIEILKK